MDGKEQSKSPNESRDSSRRYLRLDAPQAPKPQALKTSSVKANPSKEPQSVASLQEIQALTGGSNHPPLGSTPIVSTVPVDLSSPSSAAQSGATHPRGDRTDHSTEQARSRALIAARRLRQSSQLAEILQENLAEIERREDLALRMMAEAETERRLMKLWIEEKTIEINEQRLQLAEERSEVVADRFELEQACRRFEKNRSEWFAWSEKQQRELEVRITEQQFELEDQRADLDKQQRITQERLAEARRDAEQASEERNRLQAIRQTIEQHLELLNQSKSAQQQSRAELLKWFNG